MIVSGEANINMPVTGLTVAGFTQPTVARTLLEMPPAIEKGLVQRFLWIIPKPSFAQFSSLESANKDFTDYLGEYIKLCPREGVIINLTYKAKAVYTACLKEKVHYN